VLRREELDCGPATQRLEINHPGGLEDRCAFHAQELEQRPHRVSPVVARRLAPLLAELGQGDGLQPELLGAFECDPALSREPWKKFQLRHRVSPRRQVADCRPDAPHERIHQHRCAHSAMHH
jgi:hypothetical protein